MVDYDISKNNEYANILEEKLGLDSKIVAIKFYDDEDEIPQGIEKIETPVRHCEMVKKASRGE